MNTCGEPSPQLEAILALDRVQPDVPLLRVADYSAEDEDHQDRCPSAPLQMRGQWWAQHVDVEPETQLNQHQTKLELENHVGF